MSQHILALTGPSGVGKSTICNAITKLAGNVVERVPFVTTRNPKIGDEGEYVYVSLDEFQKLHASGKFACYTSVPSSTEARYYGYRIEDIENIWSKGKIPVVIADMQLLKELAEHFGRDAILSFGVLPPGENKGQKLSVLLHRLRIRGRDTEEQIHDRMKNAETDLELFNKQREFFDHLVVNDELDAAVEYLTSKVGVAAKV